MPMRLNKPSKLNSYNYNSTYCILGCGVVDVTKQQKYTSNACTVLCLPVAELVAAAGACSASFSLMAHSITGKNIM